MWIHLGYSPILARLMRGGSFGLPGVDAPPGFVESLVPQRILYLDKSTSFGWLPDWRTWFCYRLPEGCLSSGVLSVPSAIQDIVEGELQLNIALDASIGTLVNRRLVWGLGAVSRPRSPELGDYLLLVVDPKTRVAEVRLGDEGIIEDPSAALPLAGILDD